MDTLLTQLQVRRIGESTGRIDIVSTYEDYSTRARVNEYCRGLARDLGGSCKMVKQAWLVNLLRLPQLCAVAAHDAASADLIIVSLHDSDSVPEEVRSWFELWLHENGTRPRVLLGLFDTSYREGAGAMRDFLKQTAAARGLEVFIQSWEAIEGQRA
jgi:hypothetical protein